MIYYSLFFSSIQSFVAPFILSFIVASMLLLHDAYAVCVCVCVCVLRPYVLMFVCLSVTCQYCIEMTEWIELVFGIEVTLG